MEPLVCMMAHRGFCPTMHSMKLAGFELELVEQTLRLLPPHSMV